MVRTWEIDDATIVTAKVGAFGKKTISVNGQEVHSSRDKTVAFALPGGRQGALSLKSNFIGAPDVDLTVNGKLAVETEKKNPIACPACKTAAKPYDQFCGKCGHAMPTAENYRAQKYVKQATGAIKVLAVLFLIFGVLMFFVIQTQADAALAKLQNMDPSETWQAEGRTWNVGELRKQLEWEPWGVLIVNLILAAIMTLLALWGRRSPLPAVLIATATYVVVIVVNGIMEPSTLTQGLIVKIIIIAFLFRGIKAALAVRASNG
jgi:putative Ca2+/H+ antiporter (TMEM165/GDT1 family)